MLNHTSVLLSRLEQHKPTSSQSKRLFIKDMAFFLFPTPGKEPDIARSFGQQSQNESRNPTLLPKKELESFHFTFLIRDPRLSVPSYYRLSLPVHNGRSRVSKFTTDDLGYSELRRLFDYLLSERLIVPGWRGTAKWSRDRTPSLSDDSLSPSDTGSDDSSAEICVIDAEDLVHKPEAVISAYCQSTSIPYDAAMLYWGEANDQKRAEKVINQWGFDIYFHKAALESQSIRRDTKVSFYLAMPPVDVSCAKNQYDRSRRTTKVTMRLGWQNLGFRALK